MKEDNKGNVAATFICAYRGPHSNKLSGVPVCGITLDQVTEEDESLNYNVLGASLELLKHKLVLQLAETVNPDSKTQHVMTTVATLKRVPLRHRDAENLL